jgi:hypothetical protein
VLPTRHWVGPEQGSPRGSIMPYTGVVGVRCSTAGHYKDCCCQTFVWPTGWALGARVGVASRQCKWCRPLPGSATCSRSPCQRTGVPQLAGGMLSCWYASIGDCCAGRPLWGWLYAVPELVVWRAHTHTNTPVTACTCRLVLAQGQHSFGDLGLCDASLHVCSFCCQSPWLCVRHASCRLDGLANMGAGCVVLQRGCCRPTCCRWSHSAKMLYVVSRPLSGHQGLEVGQEGVCVCPSAVAAIQVLSKACRAGCVAHAAASGKQPPSLWHSLLQVAWPGQQPGVWGCPWGRCQYCVWPVVAAWAQVAHVSCQAGWVDCPVPGICCVWEGGMLCCP